MKSILLFASLAGIAAAITIYFTSESIKSNNKSISEDLAPRGFHAMG